MGGGGREERKGQPLTLQFSIYSFEFQRSQQTLAKTLTTPAGYIYIAVIVFFISMFWFPFGFGSKIGT